MVSGKIVEGSAQEIGRQLEALVGGRRIKVIVMEGEEEELTRDSRPSPEAIDRVLGQIAAEAARVGHVDDSREAIYTRMEGE